MRRASGLPVPAGARRTFAVLLVAIAAVVFAVRLPFALRDFGHRASFNDSQSALGRSIAGADAEDVDNEFLVHALSLVPRTATYAVLLPNSLEVAASYGIKPATFNALPGFVLNALLPRRQVAPALARYLLCYACKTDPYDRRMTRLWQNGRGLVIGRLSP